MSFFANLNTLISSSGVAIDRTQGSAHPRFAHAVYPVDYGYIRDTRSCDGEGIDVFRGSARDAGVVGVYLTADVGKRDAEIKVLVDCDEAEVAAVGIFLDHVLRIGGLLVRRT